MYNSIESNKKKIKPRVSILIPVFNREKYISECIESALCQSYENIEIIISDNKSTDKTWNICKRYQEKDSRVKIFQNEINCGPVLNWEKCINAATGEFSKILFSDDLLEKNCIERMIEPFSRGNIGLTFCAAAIGESKENSVTHYLRRGTIKIRSCDYLDLILSNLAPVSPGAILLRTADLKKNLHHSFPTKTNREFSVHGAGPDVMISILTSQSYEYVISIKEALVFFRVHDGSFTVKNKQNEIEHSYISAIAYYLKFNCSKKKWIRYLARRWMAKALKHNNFINVKSFLEQNEGSGSIAEISSFLMHLPYIFLEICFSTITNKNYKNFLKSRFTRIFKGLN